MTIFNLDSILTFGKYKGFSVQEVVDDDPSYLAWTIDEIEWFDLDEDTMTAMEQAQGSYQDDIFPGNNWNDFD